MPFDIIKSLLPYVVIVALSLGLLASVHKHGKDTVQVLWDKERAEQQIATAKLKEQLQDAQTKVVIKYVESDNTIKVKGNDIIRYVPTYITREANSACVIPNSFVWLHDNAASADSVLTDRPASIDAPSPVTLADVTDTIISNYTTCNRTANQLNSLIDTILAAQAVQAKPQ